MTDFEARMAALRERYVARRDEELETLAAAAAANDRAALGARAHSLAGTSAVFGYPAVGELARALEQALDRGADAEEWTAHLDRLVAALAAIGSGRSQ